MIGIKQRELTLVEAAQVMDLSYRQTKRVWRRYRADGDAGLVHRLRGAPSLRRHAPELRARVLARYDERYGDFGPTLAAEYLEADGLQVDHPAWRDCGAG
ncbi:MAG: helix-turn-helix domain-containing protein [Terriglobales bacterium]